MTVSDLDRALAFWRDALGMETVVDQESRGGYFEAIVGERDVAVRTHPLAFGGTGPRVELFQFLSPAGGRHVTRPADVGFTHVCVAVESGLEAVPPPPGGPGGAARRVGGRGRPAGDGAAGGDRPRRQSRRPRTLRPRSGRPRPRAV